ncbi:hypothetical protein [Paenibacillus mendelii]|uniref:Inhibitor I9 domain-containing protein n=1 Tax=Paenibacillus mendelii TaxID=206163 RepID=A0ABV6J9G9_9BACL|nr:hypothetical protein [Paenibacillus mendelii]MCQ6561202.1 hypothetical protein [Paenibacillus mendelii]
MDNEQAAYTVEYQDNYGVLFYANVKASHAGDAKEQILQLHPDVLIRAVTRVANDEDASANK